MTRSKPSPAPLGATLIVASSLFYASYGTWTTRMKDNDVVELRIPDALQGRLNYVGAWLPLGRIRVRGDVADHAGYRMATSGHLQIDGSARHFLGQGMSGYARIDIDGDAGDFLGSNMSGHSSILVNGDAGDYCGHRMRSADSGIEVLGGAGNHLGSEAKNGEIKVGGRIGAVSKS